MKDRFWYINTNKLFSGLPEADKNIIHSMMVPVNIRKNKLIYSQGDMSDTLYILKEGRIKLNTFSEDGRELTIEILEPGDIFGEVAITGENPRETSAVALEDSFLCMIDGAPFKGFLAERSYLALKITKLVGWRLSELTN